MTGAHGYVVLKPRAFFPVIVRASQSSIFLPMLIVTVITALYNRNLSNNRSRGGNLSLWRHVLPGSNILLA
jgi:hypothetical protein